METGRLTRWLKQPGDPVKVGDVLAEVESDKAAMDLEAFADGYLAGPVAPTDTEIPVKSTIAWIPKVEQFDAIVPAGATAVLAVSAPGTDGLTRLTLSCDHRVVAGVDAACFLATLAEHLAEPDALMN